MTTNYFRFITIFCHLSSSYKGLSFGHPEASVLYSSKCSTIDVFLLGFLQFCFCYRSSDNNVYLNLVPAL